MMTRYKALSKEILDMAKKIEWIELFRVDDYIEESVYYCPWCFGRKPTHLPTCKWGDALKELRESE